MKWGDSVTSHPRAAGALFGLGVLTLINFVNYLDRYIVASLLPRIEDDFHLGHQAAGTLGTVFIMVLMIASPIGGFLGDRVPRRLLVGGGVFLWSVATLASGLAHSFQSLLIARAFVGIGEAAYGTIAPSIISDLFPREQRTRMLAFFYAALPAGAAAGYGLGGWLGQTYSWHLAFFVGGVPGLFLAAAMLFIREPARGATEASHGPDKIPLGKGLRLLSRNGLFWSNTIGLTLMTFSIGGLAFWMPAFLERERGIDAKIADVTFGAITLVAGLLGTLTGGWLGDWADRKRAFGGMWVSGLGLIFAVPLIYLAATVHQGYFAFMFCALFLLFLNNGPINASILNSVPAASRAFAMGLSVLVLHLFGDALSPTAIGAIADRWNLAAAIRVNALPVLAGGIVLLLGAIVLARPARVMAGGRSSAT